jgi:hypothetical protein
VNAEPRDRASAIFLGLAAIPPEDREAWEAAQCGTDAALRAAVDAILAAVDAPGDFLDPAALHPRALDADTPLAAGTRIGDFTVQQPVGAGSAGIVYVARQRHPTRTWRSRSCDAAPGPPDRR